MGTFVPIIVGDVLFIALLMGSIIVFAMVSPAAREFDEAKH